MTDLWPKRLCPFGVNGDEPMAEVDGWIMGVREAALRGLVSEAVAHEIYPGDWDFTEAERAWAAEERPR